MELVNMLGALGSVAGLVTGLKAADKIVKWVENREKNTHDAPKQ